MVFQSNFINESSLNNSLVKIIVGGDRSVKRNWHLDIEAKKGT